MLSSEQCGLCEVAFGVRTALEFSPDGEGGGYIGRDRGKASILARSTGRLDPRVSEGEEQVTVLTHSVLLAVCLS